MVKSSQSGFTLIELVVVIVILGILAAFAVPRFMGMETEARIATLKSMGGSLNAAAAMAHGKCLAQNCGAAGLVTVDGQGVRMVNSYPNRATVDRTLASTEGFTVTNVAGVNGALARRYSKAGAPTANCWVQYNEAAAGLPPVISFNRGVIPTTASEAQVMTDLLASC